MTSPSGPPEHDSEALGVLTEYIERGSKFDDAGQIAVLERWLSSQENTEDAALHCVLAMTQLCHLFVTLEGFRYGGDVGAALQKIGLELAKREAREDD